jgi:hypothetical protein
MTLFGTERSMCKRMDFASRSPFVRTGSDSRRKSEEVGQVSPAHHKTSKRIFKAKATLFIFTK